MPSGEAPRVVSLRLNQITIDPTVQPRVNGLNTAHVAEIVESIKSGVKLPPGVAYDVGDRIVLSEGFHRYEAFTQAKRTHFSVEVRGGTLEECRLNALASNQGHGLKRTNADKKRALEEVLKIVANYEPKWADGTVADFIGVSRQFVSDNRPQVATIATSTVTNDPDQVATVATCQPDKVLGRDGKVYPAKPKKPKSKSADGKPLTQPEPAQKPEPVNQETTVEVDNSEQVDTDTEQSVEGDAGAEFVQAVESVCRELDQSAARMRELKSSAYSHSVHFDSAVSQVEAARKTLWQGRPSFPCPYCEQEGGVRPNCNSCRGLNRVKKTTFDSGRAAHGGGK